jgi:hypothetical protein
MRFGRFGTLVHATVLALALLPAVAGAQAIDDEPIPDPVPLRVEIGAGVGFTLAYPEIGLLASVPMGPRTAFEVGVAWLPSVRRPDASPDSASEHFLVQAQVRMPFRAHLRSRKSLLIGVTRVFTQEEDRFDNTFWDDDATVVIPHAGVSLQWPMGRYADFRFDAQGLFTLDGELPLVPRAVGTFVWHPGPPHPARTSGGSR